MKVASLLLVGICACSAKGGTLGQSDSQSVGTALGSGIEASAKVFGPMNAMTTAANGCVTISGDVADADQDNIPNDATLTFNCTTTSLGLTSTLTGTMSVTDDQPTAIAWAFTGSQALDATVTDQRGDNITVTTSGQLTATQQTNVFGLERAATVTTTVTDARGQSVSVDETADWNVTFTPQATWSPGQVVVTGDLDAQGSWNVVVGDNSAAAAIATTATLALDPACDTRVTGGAVEATWASGAHTAVLDVEWVGCGQSNITFSEQ